MRTGQRWGFAPPLGKKICTVCNSCLPIKGYRVRHLVVDYFCCHSDLITPNTGLPTHSDSVGTAKKCHCKRNVTVSGIFRKGDPFMDQKTVTVAGMSL